MAYDVKRFVDYAGLEKYTDEILPQIIGEAVDGKLSAVSYIDVDKGSSGNPDVHKGLVTTNGSPHTVVTLDDLADDLMEELPIDTAVTANSTNLVTSGAVYTVIGDIETLLAAL